MTLTFTQENGLYVAEFEASAPFSIHLERPKGGFINMLQRSVDSGTFVAVKNFNPNYNATQVIDADYGQGAVYPKWIRLESAVEPSVAEVTFEDEQSGGGAGTESGGAEPTEYYSINWTKLNELGYTDDDFSNNASSFLRDAVFSCSAYKIIMQGNTRIVNINEMWQIVTLLDGVFRYSFITAIAFTPYTQLSTNTYISSLKDIWNWVGQPFDEIFTPITKEQFYNLEA